MPATNLVLSPTLVQPLLRRIWVYVLTIQSSVRVANKALYFAIWILFARLFPLRRAPPQTRPPRGGRQARWPSMEGSRHPRIRR
eukprot:8886210-Pyramimonas_sp.AAC.1